MAELPPRPSRIVALHAHRAALEELWRLTNKLKWRFGEPRTGRLVADFDRAMESVLATRAAYDAEMKSDDPHDRCDKGCPDDAPDDSEDREAAEAEAATQEWVRRGEEAAFHTPMPHELADDEKWPYLDAADFWRD